MNNNDKQLLKSICKQERIETVQEFRDYFGALNEHGAPSVAPAYLHTYYQCRQFYNSNDIELWYCIGNHVDECGYEYDALTYIQTFGEWNKRLWSLEIESAGHFACKVVWVALHIIANELREAINDNPNEFIEDLNAGFIKQFLSVPEAKEVTN